jgi:SPP1 gp7 family putative phage head morphogenesis protein
VTAEDETDSLEQIQADLNDSAIGWLDGTALETGASLNASTIINSARNAFFFDDQVLEEVEAFEFVNGDPVTEICQDLNGTVFAKDDPAADRYMPPLHWNCKSYIVPILKGNLGNKEIEKLKPSNKRLDAMVQFDEHQHCEDSTHV